MNIKELLCFEDESHLTERIVLSWVRTPRADEAGLTEQLRKGVKLVLARC